jgi:hypothetical protein
MGLEAQTLFQSSNATMVRHQLLFSCAFLAGKEHWTECCRTFIAGMHITSVAVLCCLFASGRPFINGPLISRTLKYNRLLTISTGTQAVGIFQYRLQHSWNEPKEGMHKSADWR